nr:MAG TPA: hypothetical protein [Bacteriophage sp.]
MATTLTNPIATVTLAGTAERITLPSTYSWIWVRNDTDAAVYISQADDVGEGVSGSVAVPAGGAARLALTGDSFYAVGTGAVQIVAANYTDCPFKDAPAVSGGGSESGGNGMTLIASVAGVNTTSKTIEGFDIKVGDRYYFEGYYQATISGYSKQFVFINSTVEVCESSQVVKVPFYALNSTGTPIHSDRSFLNIAFSNSTMSLMTGESGLAKLNIYKLD